MTFFTASLLLVIPLISFSQTNFDPKIERLLNAPESRVCKNLVNQMDHVEVFNHTRTFEQYEIMGLMDNGNVSVVLSNRSFIYTGIGGAGRNSFITCSVNI